MSARPTLWEISIKRALKPNLMPILGSKALLLFRASGYCFLGISPESATKIEELPPFIRIHLIVC